MAQVLPLSADRYIQSSPGLPLGLPTELPTLTCPLCPSSPHLSHPQPPGAFFQIREEPSSLLLFFPCLELFSHYWLTSSHPSGLSLVFFSAKFTERSLHNRHVISSETPPRTPEMRLILLVTLTTHSIIMGLMSPSHTHGRAVPGRAWSVFTTEPLYQAWYRAQRPFSACGLSKCLVKPASLLVFPITMKPEQHVHRQSIIKSSSFYLLNINLSPVYSLPLISITIIPALTTLSSA